MKRVLAFAALIAAMGCGEANPPASPETTAQQAPAPVRDRPTEVEMVATMEAHYSAVIAAHDALARGDIETFKAQLALVPVQALPANSPQEWAPLHEVMRAAARGEEKVSDLDTAASAFGQVVLACGMCHTALGTGPIYPAPAPADGDDAIETAMLDHQWATERLWEGVTGPWDNAWERGADALARIEIFGEPDPERTVSDEIRQREQAFRALGEEAKTTTALGDRAALYGHLLATCGACHQATGVTFDDSK